MSDANESRAESDETFDWHSPCEEVEKACRVCLLTENDGDFVIESLVSPTQYPDEDVKQPLAEQRAVDLSRFEAEIVCRYWADVIAESDEHCANGASHLWAETRVRLHADHRMFHLVKAGLMSLERARELLADAAAKVRARWMAADAESSQEGV